MSVYHKLITLLCLLVMMGSPLLYASEKLNVLAWPGYADTDLVQVFEQRYKVDVDVTIIDSDDAMWDRLTAKTGKKFDLFAVNTAQLQRYIDKGVSVPLRVSNIPNTAGQLPRFRDLSSLPALTRNDKQYAIPYTYSEMGLIYDRKTFSVPPDSFSSMWDKRFQGRVLMYGGSEHNYSLAAMVLGLNNPFQLSENDFKHVSRFLVALRRNVLTFYEKPQDATRLFINNNIALLFANYGSQQLTLLKKAGADIGYVIPKEGALAWLDCWSVTRFAKNRKLAETFINYMLEKSVSQALTQRQGLANTLENLSTMHTTDKIVWLQQVENSARRKLLWDRIISGDKLNRF